MYFQLQFLLVWVARYQLGKEMPKTKEKERQERNAGNPWKGRPSKTCLTNCLHQCQPGPNMISLDNIQL